MKILFINHDVSNYGASTSLRLMLRSLVGNADFDLAVPLSLKNIKNTKVIREKFYVNGALIFLPLIYLNYFVGKKDRWTIFDYAHKIIHTICFITIFPFLWVYIKVKNYDYIHINSLVLAPAVFLSPRCILHVRELWDGRMRWGMFKLIGNYNKIIFIDKNVLIPFLEVEHKGDWRVIANPIDMSSIPTLDMQDVDLKLEILTSKCHIFALIGSVTEEKGISFILNAICAIPDKFKLIIVGSGDLSLMCAEVASRDSRIFYVGEMTDVMPIYFLADTIIRGDDFPRMGRTILEGLYSGCNVLLPGGTQDYSSIESDMHNLLFFYKKRDGDSFIYSLRKCISRGKSVKEGKSSTSIYIKEFLNFLN